MNICMLNSSYLPAIGGVENHIYNISKELTRLGHKVIIINTLLNKNLKDFKKEELDGLTVYRVYLNKILTQNNQKVNNKLFQLFFGYLYKLQYNLNYSKTYKIVKEIIKSEDIQIIHQHDLTQNIMLTKKLAKEYPIVITNHTSEYNFLKRILPKFLLKKLLSHYSHIIGISKERSDIPVAKNKVSCIYNGVDFNRFLSVEDSDKIQLKKQFGFKKEDFIIFCSSRWAPIKGIEVLVKAIEFVKSDENIKFVFAGSDNKNYQGYIKKIKKMLEKYEESKIVLLGDLNYDIINKYYQISDIVIIPSYSDGINLASLEAMATELPIIASDVDGLFELIDDKKTGFLFKVGDSKELAYKINNLLHDKQLRLKLGKSAKKSIINKYTWEIATSQIIDIYKRLL